MRQTEWHTQNDTLLWKFTYRFPHLYHNCKCPASSMTICLKEWPIYHTPIISGIYFSSVSEAIRLPCVQCKCHWTTRKIYVEMSVFSIFTTSSLLLCFVGLFIKCSNFNEVTLQRLMETTSLQTSYAGKCYRNFFFPFNNSCLQVEVTANVQSTTDTKVWNNIKSPQSFSFLLFFK